MNQESPHLQGGECQQLEVNKQESDSEAQQRFAIAF